MRCHVASDFNLHIALYSVKSSCTAAIRLSSLRHIRNRFSNINAAQPARPIVLHRFCIRASVK